MNDLFDLDVRIHPSAQNHVPPATQNHVPPGRQSTGEGDSTCGDETSCGNECSSVAGNDSCDDY